MTDIVETTLLQRISDLTRWIEWVEDYHSHRGSGDGARGELLTYLHYSPTITREAISAALLRCRRRNLQPVSVIVRPDAEIEAGEVDGVTVEVSNKPRPKGHWWVVCEE